MSEQIDGNLGISRRDLIKKGAIAGGTLIWAVPLIETVVASPASAGTGSAFHTCCSCTKPTNTTCTGRGRHSTCVADSVPPDGPHCHAYCNSITGHDGNPCKYKSIVFMRSPNPLNCSHPQNLCY